MSRIGSSCPSAGLREAPSSPTRSPPAGVHDALNAGTPRRGADRLAARGPLRGPCTPACPRIGVVACLPPLIMFISGPAASLERPPRCDTTGARQRLRRRRARGETPSMFVRAELRLFACHRLEDSLSIAVLTAASAPMSSGHDAVDVAHRLANALPLARASCPPSRSSTAVRAVDAPEAPSPTGERAGMMSTATVVSPRESMISRPRTSVGCRSCRMHPAAVRRRDAGQVFLRSVARRAAAGGHVRHLSREAEPWTPDRLSSAATVRAPLEASARRAFVPVANAGISMTPTGPFQKIVFVV